MDIYTVVVKCFSVIGEHWGTFCKNIKFITRHSVGYERESRYTILWTL